MAEKKTVKAKPKQQRSPKPPKDYQLIKAIRGKKTKKYRRRIFVI